MASENSQGRTLSLVEIQDAHLAMISATRDEAARLFEAHAGDDTLATETLKQLFRYMSARSQAASFLISWEYAWDAEIVLRSFYDTVAKIVMMCRAKSADKTKLVEEFWDGLGYTGDLRRARQAGFARTAARNNADTARVFEYLQSPKSLRDAQSPGNRAARKAIERKWSFSQVMEMLDKELPGAKSLLHNYGMSSHLLHADPAALELMMDRALRVPDELQLLRAAHACRIFSDQIALWYLCAASLAHHFGDELSNARDLRERFDACCAMAAPLHKRFAESQDEFYRQSDSGEISKT